MSLRAAALSRQRGVAVITALLLTTLAITIVASLFWQQQVQVRSIENQRLQLQKQWIYRGALDWARLILREDAKTGATDDLNEAWAVPLAETPLDQYVENGRADTDASDASLSGSIVDAQSRYNLRNLSADGIVNPREVAVFKSLLVKAGLRPELAQATADMMAATQKKKVAAPGGPGVPGTPAGGKPSDPQQSNQQQSNQPPSGTQPMEIAQVDDLLAVPEFSAEMLNKVRDWIVVLPRATPVNVNTAPAEVLEARLDTITADAITAADAAALVASRKIATFRAADFATRLPGKTLSSSAKDISFGSEYFLVNGKVRMNRAALEAQALIERNATTYATAVIWIREN